jgi:ABC-2 type transport system ATP-binding protein
VTAPPPTQWSIEADGLAKWFGDKPAVNGVSLRVAAGEFYGFLGPNGAGKSTTLKMLTGLLRPDAGTARILGHDVWADPIAAKRLIGILPEDNPLHERLTGWELIRFTARVYGIAPEVIEQRGAELCDLMELSEEDRHRLVVDYSTGMAKKVALVAAMVHAPRVLFLDEPFGGIDPVAGRAIRGALQAAVDHGVTIFFSSHILEVVEKLCTRYAIIDKGRIQANGTLDEMRSAAQLSADASLEDVFVQLVGARTPHADLTWL